MSKHCMRRVKRNQAFFTEISKSKPAKRKLIMEKASKDNIDAISEVAHNTLLGNLPLTKRQLEVLKKHKHSVRQLAHKKTSRKKKKSLLIQKGGFLPLLIGPLLSILGGLSANAISSAIGL